MRPDIGGPDGRVAFAMAPENQQRMAALIVRQRRNHFDIRAVAHFDLIDPEKHRPNTAMIPSASMWRCRRSGN